MLKWFLLSMCAHIHAAVGLLLTLKSRCAWVQVCLWALSPVDTCCLPVLLTPWLGLGNAPLFLQCWPSLVLSTRLTVAVFLLKCLWEGGPRHCNPWVCNPADSFQKVVHCSKLAWALDAWKWEEGTELSQMSLEPFLCLRGTRGKTGRCGALFWGRIRLSCITTTLPKWVPCVHLAPECEASDTSLPSVLGSWLYFLPFSQRPCPHFCCAVLVLPRS